MILASQSSWSCAFSSGSVAPKKQGNTQQLVRHSSFLSTGKSFELGMAEEGGYDQQSGEEVVESGATERLTRLQCTCANAPGPGNSKAIELCMKSHSSVPHGWNNSDEGDVSRGCSAAGQEQRRDSAGDMVLSLASRRRVHHNTQEDKQRYWLMWLCRGIYPTTASLTVLLTLELEEETKSVHSQTAGLFFLE